MQKQRERKRALFHFNARFNETFSCSIWFIHMAALFHRCLGQSAAAAPLL